MKERRMVPEPEFGSYYGRPILKEPVWKQQDVPLYLFSGGLAGTSALLAEGAALTGRPGLLRAARIAAAGGATAGSALLVHDLGRPERFLNMLRVLKITSPLSVGSWILASFSGLSTAAAASELTGRLPAIGRLAGVGAGILGPALATYTAVLIADTSVPAWHEAHRELPFVFAGGAAAAGGGLGMVAASTDEAGPARRMALAGGVAELAASEVMIRRLGIHAEVYRQGRAGTVLKASRVLTAVGVGLTPFARRSRWVSAVAGTAYMAGSALKRFGTFHAGLASARDPKYTVVPQRERVSND